ncbi:hypothetical protein DUI87_18153 [Hirundo rustica rustica]|uniref:Uncharacterized protein n=1 Tax=Hirundo rustica rustica TaxID=333673 RepID=A0A3M0JV99_HIRRU|nr:hypothetical protein DUI87_18153 [Hirundo rustica rustica]
MCDMIDSQSAEKISRMKKLRRTLSESFGRIALKKEDSSFDECNTTGCFKKSGHLKLIDAEKFCMREDTL